MQCGLLGRKLGHSYSPQIHNMLADYDYQLFEVEPEVLQNFLHSGAFSGLNVTIPYKKAVIPLLNKLSDRAQKLGAVNTVVRRNGELIGHNTDYYGFASMVQRSGVPVSGKKALVLGSGGASATAVAVLEEMGAAVTVISRSGADNYNNLERHADAAILVNATPVGMYPDTDQSPVDLAAFPNLECVLDLIYNPANTKLLQDAQARDIKHQNGLWMLVAQAKESAEWFTEATIPDHKIQEIYDKIRFQMENIILIGMPGCGKTTVGTHLAKLLDRAFVDADTAVIEASGMTIPEIFANEGEDGFRTRESQVLATLGKASGLVIATGGGCVMRPENYRLLHQNGTLVWLQRDIGDLPTEGRPLSQSNRLTELYRIRRPMYEAFSDLTADNNGDPCDTARTILTQLQGGSL